MAAAQMANIEVRVTAKHVKNGTRCNSGKCPVALALLDAGFQRVYVGSGNSISGYQEKLLSTGVNLSVTTLKSVSKVTEFIDKFDGKEQPKGFTFTVTAPVRELARIKFSGDYTLA